MRNLQTKDLFSLARVLKEIKIQEVFNSITIDNGMTTKEAGLKLVFEIFEKAVDKNCEEKVYEFLAGPLEISKKEVAEYDPVDLLDKVLEIAEPDKWKAFFSKAAQLVK